ncbi:hypothetical protein [Streptomyces sp. NPDC006638]|uniref:DUF6928 family protein n=1 Tax=Streptomyces sp. NPDC006638 TaxID=3157183 RepID=UPI00339E51D3
MGSKAAVVMFVEADPREVFRNGLEINHLKSKLLAEEILGTAAHETEPVALDLAVWPSVGVACTASLPGLEVVCSRKLAKPHPSQLTEEISRLAAGRVAYGVFMHSAEDWAAFAVWSGGELVRAFSVSPEAGIIEDVGEHLPFETPFWSGERAVRNEVKYALPFHPLQLGNEALRAFFGFILEGREDASCFDPEEFEIPSFRQV